ncbi:hypothetical protein T552_00316 [Pneumocystis carinii B80]|uniref:Arginyl-tRNA--protein transferase 1 n=1 Tax=Pneumocystis carinii (strain B80) TaxID=1408658 RepID=A0A0W4ZQF1_PNEC8|nr:hypothetical protein T552_00316 [Pneumocystis carinii B80]KTW30599.1 hypothetical protein T552_00316 [Pneumocystis carinii B80]
MGVEFVRFLGYSSDRCGYCGLEGESHRQDVVYSPEKGLETIGMWAYTMKCQKKLLFLTSQYSDTNKTYEVLLNRGWRRSGHYIYKPNGKRSCCKLYTIRLDVEKFKPNKNQRRAVKRLYQHIWNKTVPEKQGWDLFDIIREIETEDMIDDRSIFCHRFKVTIESNEYTDEKYALYVNYQTYIHKEPEDRIKKKGFIRFLCDTPLKYEPKTGCGTFHQCYRLDGRLIAMGVIDILPGGISSVYFMYENNIQNMCLGKISACREISLARERKCQFYYMGYYIYNHQKMKYKGEYHPSELLDPETYKWIPLKRYLEHWKLGGSLYISFHTLESTPNILSSMCDVSHPDSLYIETLENETTKHSQKYRNSLFNYDVPGILKENDVQNLDLEKILVFEDMRIVPVSHSKYYKSEESVRHMIMESVSAVGIELAKKLCFIINI